MTMQQPVSDLASTQEAALTLRDLSQADLLRLKQIAKMRSSGLVSLDWEDLVNEAVARVLAGTRRWPKSVPFIAFMAQTIRSVASEEWRRLDQAQVTLESEMAATDDGEPITSLADIAANPIHPEREVIARRTLSEIEALFVNDAEAHQVLFGLAQGLAPAEIQTDSGMSPIQYASAQKRIRRSLARQFSVKDET